MHRGLARVLPTALLPRGTSLLLSWPHSPASESELAENHSLAESPFWPSLRNRSPLRKLTDVWLLDSA